MINLTTVLLVVAGGLLASAGWATLRASGPRTVDIPVWPAVAAFGLAVILLGAAVVVT